LSSHKQGPSPVAERRRRMKCGKKEEKVSGNKVLEEGRI